jgi:hypothetical protein
MSTITIDDRDSPSILEGEEARVLLWDVTIMWNYIERDIGNSRFKGRITDFGMHERGGFPLVANHNLVAKHNTEDDAIQVKTVIGVQK